ncbi:YceD family protein [Legionella nagasakiensis]|uniref:YceD family protein n=1 Tax=Legionella nagasakiensis TaxID=535290 RepID=UPI0010559A83|nr:YceD family protein [Legionella nagasakiensis]
MKISLAKLAKEKEVRHADLTIEERLPAHLSMACHLSCDYWVEATADNYILLRMSTKGSIEIVCQRCLHVFPCDYHHETQLAVCLNDAIAEKLMEQYECMVSDNYTINLAELITDELHLNTPEKHLDPATCDSDVKRYIHDII